MKQRNDKTNNPLPLPAVLERATYANAERARDAALVTLEQFQAYAYRFRDAAFKFSNLGRTPAREHARRYGLRLPLSDLTQAERDAVRAEQPTTSNHNRSKQ